MHQINKLIYQLLKMCPKGIVKIFSKRYVAGFDFSETLKICKNLNNEGFCLTLDILGEKNGGMVVGHTPQYNITGQCRDRLWFADIGLSGAFGNTMFNKIQILEIKNNVPRVI